MQHEDLSIISLVLNASVVVQLILVLLVSLSIGSWSIIIRKGFALGSVKRATEMDSLESNLPFLASVGSVSPYIGLFGTVWGIMNSFRGLANVQQATLASVAPGIAEALVATAIGLFAAIPAVVFYNRSASDVDRLAIRFETFIEEFTNILQRQTHGKYPTKES